MSIFGTVPILVIRTRIPGACGNILVTWSFFPVFLVIDGVGIGTECSGNFKVFVHKGLGLGNRELGGV